jgi:GDPmannose 4,6-dehydratase
MVKIALITGITGQDGSYLAEFLLNKDYIIYGVVRRSSIDTTERIKDIKSNKNLVLKYGDITDSSSLSNIIFEIKVKYPEMDRLEIYNMAAQSHVRLSFDMPEYTCEVDALGTLRLLEAIKHNNITDKVRFYQASTSELFGLVQEVPQSENTPFYPRSPYGVAKLYSFWIVKNYRESYNMFACNGILFNHESKKRAENFVTRKITIGLGKILRGEEKTLRMGNINALRDWGHSSDFIRGMWLMLQQEKPDDYILATGEMHSVREFIEKAFALRGFNIKWKGEGVDEIGYDSVTGRELIFIDPEFYRPAEVEQLLGNPAKAERELGWKPEITFEELIKEMVEQDC